MDYKHLSGPLPREVTGLSEARLSTADPAGSVPLFRLHENQYDTALAL